PSPTPTAKPTPTPTATPAPTSIPEVSPVHVQTQYEWFINLSPAEQDAYKDSFGSLEAFFNWFNAAQAENNSTQNNFIELAPGETIDLSKY
ncbi:MAG: hypothetical protein Q4E35_09675, partial [Eubacteriales bacterium]|nr:hypothetical protein [Eubacteriales bacterium]